DLGTGEVRRSEPARPAAVPDGSPAVRVDCGPGRLDRTPTREPAGEIAWRSSAASTSTGSSGARTTAVMPQPLPPAPDRELPLRGPRPAGPTGPRPARSLRPRGRVMPHAPTRAGTARPARRARRRA